jgi:hypothetical protein
MPASRAATTIAATQAVESRKKRKRAGLVVSADTTTASSDVETINVEENEEDDTKSPNALTERAAQMPRKVVGGE